MASNENTTDEEIIKLLAADDRKSISLIYKHHARALFHNIRKLVDREEDAEDIVQDLIILIWEKRRSLKMRAPVRNYLLIAVYHRTLNHLHENGKHGKIISLPTEELDLFPGPRYNMGRKELHKQIHDALWTIPGKTRMVFLLSVIFKMSNQEIADHFGVSLKAIEKHVTSARKTLKFLLAHLHMIIILSGAIKYSGLGVGFATILLY